MLREVRAQSVQLDRKDLKVLLEVKVRLAHRAQQAHKVLKVHRVQHC